uniref:Putative ovule protein n=1 Tax=Solanum chacoense TaxID=4108 RepID=A0A0V0I309_SOLCH
MFSDCHWLKKISFRFGKICLLKRMPPKYFAEKCQFPIFVLITLNCKNSKIVRVGSAELLGTCCLNNFLEIIVILIGKATAFCCSCTNL